MAAATLCLAALALAAPLKVSAQYSLNKTYSGDGFFNDWDFYGEQLEAHLREVVAD